MDNFIIAGKAKSVFRLVKLMAQGEKATTNKDKMKKKIQGKFSLN